VQPKRRYFMAAKIGENKEDATCQLRGRRI
jgi:hypothetical protein